MNNNNNNNNNNYYYNNYYNNGDNVYGADIIVTLDSLSTSINIDRWTTVDNTSVLSGAAVNKWLSTSTRERQIPPDSESGGIPHLFGTSLSAPYRQCLTGSS